jgi:hypothetical protein
MTVNINHPTFIAFLEQVTNKILSGVSVENYFNLSQEKKLRIQYMVFKLMKNLTKMRGKFNDSELKSFVNILCKKNEEYENYEFSGILNDISNNFDKINELTITKKRTNKQIKIENKE